MEKTSFYIKDNLRLFLGFIVVILVVILIISFYVNTSDKKVGQVKVNNQAFKVKIAKTDQEKQIGSIKTKKLPDNQGMLFLFNDPGFYSFWMKEMQFPIDIIYINGNKVTTIIKNATPPSKSQSLVHLSTQKSVRQSFGSKCRYS